MPIFPNQTEPEIDGREREDTAAAQSGSQSDAQSGSQGGGRGEAPLSFVPHPGNGAQAVKIQTGRYGELDHHELIRLLDTIEDERARSRFRESVYLSIFVWIVVAWVVLYGPRYLWHAPQLINPSDVLKQREVVHLDSPVLTPHMKSPAPRPTVENKLDNKTLEKLRAMAKSAPTAPPAAPPTATQPAPTATAPVVPPQVTPQPQVRTPPPVVAEAPTPQAPTRPNFGRPSSAGDAIQQAIQGSAQGRGGTGTASMGSGRGAQTQTGTGVDILSDTQGVNFDPYLRRILAQIYQQWILLIPEEARPPLSKQGTTLVRFTINADGSLGHMALDGSTHDDALNRAAWGSINGQQFPPLPPQFHGPNLELRIRFLVNQKTE